MFDSYVLFIILVTRVFLSASGLSLAAESGGFSLVAVHRLLPAVAFPVAEHVL